MAMAEELTEQEIALLQFLIEFPEARLLEVMAEFDLTDDEATALLKSIGKKRPRDKGQSNEAQL